MAGRRSERPVVAALNAPFLLAAQLTGRLDRRYRVAGVVAAGCVAGRGRRVRAEPGHPTTPFLLTAAGYLLGRGRLRRPGPRRHPRRHARCPAGISGAASGVVNASRQIGTSVGLAVLGSVGVTSAISALARVPPGVPGRQPAPRRCGKRQNVGGRRRVNAVAQALGPAYRQPPPSRSRTGTTWPSASERLPPGRPPRLPLASGSDLPQRQRRPPSLLPPAGNDRTPMVPQRRPTTSAPSARASRSRIWAARGSDWLSARSAASRQAAIASPWSSAPAGYGRTRRER